MKKSTTCLSEATIRNAGFELLTAMGIFCWIDYQPTSSGKGARRGYHRSSTGVADILAVHKGMAYAIEVKKPGQKTKPHQDEWLESFSLAGGQVFIARGADDFIKIAKTIRS